jgi:hypothetical protein
MGLTTLPYKKIIVEKPPRNSAGFCGGGQGLSWAVEPRKEEEEEEERKNIYRKIHNSPLADCHLYSICPLKLPIDRTLFCWIACYIFC